MNDKQIASVRFLAKMMEEHYPAFIQDLFYPEDYKSIDFSNIGETSSWVAMDVYHLDDDDYLCEIDDEEEAYNQYGDRVIIDSDDIDVKYAFSFGDYIGFYVITMVNGTIYLGRFCGD